MFGQKNGFYTFRIIFVETNSLMRPITYVIADDEAVYRTMLESFLQALPQSKCLRICENALEVSSFIHDNPPDVLLLDIEMPGLSGLQLVKSLLKQPYVIFISSHGEYALDAFEVDAIDFIRKPIPPERLLRAMEKVRTLLQMKEDQATLENFRASPDDYFFIREDGAYVRINYDEVLYIESLSDFVKIYLRNKQEKLVLVNLKNLLLQLPSSEFVRISRTHVVYKKAITAVTKDSVILHEIQLPFSAQYAAIINDAIIGNKAIKRHA